ncbi:MAG: DUF1080 domain-containing protein [Planctomycetes bacterium]|nr:DUF1080 domain-containing protein [Planctomycetota bacterium]
MQLALAAIAVLLAQTPRVVVHADRPGPRIPSSLYGVFFEEINHAGDGGLVAELLRNRSFDEPIGNDGRLAGWSIEPAAGVAVATRVVTRLDPRGNTLHHVEVDCDGLVRVVNAGFFGLHVEQGASYRVRIDVRSNDSVPMSCAFRAGDEIVAEAMVPVTPGAGSVIAALVADRSADVQFELRLHGPGSVAFDFVSCEPEATWRGRHPGMRKDLADAVAALRPAFVRFPGGCFVEGGDRLDDAFAWKNTLGDVATRPGHRNANWGYWSSDALGFHEYLQWCEDLNAEPLFVVNCGMSHREVVPLDRLGPWIQDALDAIEYANGPVDSRYGAERARNGHPEPFRLKLVEIGNENGMFGAFGGSRDAYAERYAAFSDAIRARHPDVELIANVPLGLGEDWIDEHYYNSPEWFWQNEGRYDAVARGGPRIYVGEYAVTSGAGTGNLAAALAEAAFLIGIERNGDLVQRASYAPLFVHAQDRRWNPDLIVFDARASYGTPSFHVHAMFAEHRPSVALAVDVPELETESVPTGAIGLGTWNTSAEFKDITIDVGGTVVDVTPRGAELGAWRTTEGEWSVVDGAIRTTSHAEPSRIVLRDPDFAELGDVTLRLKARKLDGDEGFLVQFRTRGDDAVWLNLGGWGNREHAFEKTVGGAKLQLGPHVRGAIETGRWYDVRIECAGESIRGYLDGRLVLEVRDRTKAWFTAGAGLDDPTGDIVVKLVNGTGTARRIELALEGTPAIEDTVRIWTLSGAGPAAENGFGTTNAISAKPSELRVGSPTFELEVPAHAIVVVRARPRPQ